MISTADYSALPPAADLQRICKALAVLDAINSPDWEYRYYSYNPDWAPDEAMLEMRDGEGDQMLVLNNTLCGEYEYGDIVVARKESFSSEPIVKRVIATEGQTVDISISSIVMDPESSSSSRSKANSKVLLPLRKQ